MDSRELTLTRDCDAIQIPSGNPITLPIGTSVIITQSLGGTYTVATCRPGPHRRKRISTHSASNPTEFKTEKKAVEGSLEEAVWNQLKTVFDPEIPVNVVDLGLIYDCLVEKDDAGQTNVRVKMTLTAPGCGMGPTIAADARQKVLILDGVDEAAVDLVWDPPWNQSMISEAGRMKLGLI